MSFPAEIEEKKMLQADSKTAAAEKTAQPAKNDLCNSALVRNDEEAMANYLRDRNLARTNAQSPAVHPKDTLYTRYVKRLLDICISLPAFLVTLPFNLVFGVCTYFDVGRPILFKQTRCGKDGKPFTMIKFRNMTNKTDETGKLLPAKERITKFGHFMRKLSLDELLNFWNVLKGDMSIIGPRPVPGFYVDRMSERHKMRHAVRPGLECPRMIEADDQAKSLYHWKFENDVWYVENVSFLTDVRMIFYLVKMTFSMKTRGAHADHASYFVGYDDNGCAMSLTAAKLEYGEAPGKGKQN